jgi:hypothetical protein
MGLLDKLTINGSVYSYGDGQTPSTNPGATGQSKLHADGNTPGYSLSGDHFSEVNGAYQSYNDGFGNNLPRPSLLDINGAIPTGPLSDPSAGSINNTFSQGQYLNNLPE